MSETDAWYLQYVKQLPASEIDQVIRFSFTDGDTGEMTREKMLLHVITHGAYHWGNVEQILKSISVAPLRDHLTKYLHISEPERGW
ncbi:DinB family protein [Limnohabitans sp. 2KL-17]|uniref:DinB family protein n=1 Tax=Limnohabitans sp. 2KL-17 TaxID=1100704 RepID=UPI001E460322|nr:DinB family protein [Limnohabitans sp. 2KL-17]